MKQEPNGLLYPVDRNGDQILDNSIVEVIMKKNSMVLNKIRYDKMIQKRLDGGKGYPSYYKYVDTMFSQIDDIKDTALVISGKK